ncbi:MAG: rhodanese-like domain-containing protein [Candidatus Kapaibacterium sp.]
MFRITLFLVLFTAFSVNACSYDSTDAVTKEEIAQVKEELVIIDVRTNMEFKMGHIDGALLIPYNQIGSKIKNEVPDKSIPIALYCRTGRRSGIAKRTLLDMGYANVMDLGAMGQAKQKLDK